MGKRKHLQQMVLAYWKSIWRRMHMRSISIAMHKTQVQEDQRPHINPATLNFKVGSSLEHMDTGDHFPTITPVSQTLRATMNK